MQHPTLQIRDRLLAGLDREYNVVDMALVIEVLSQLESISITKEALEITRLGKHINELRRKSSDRNLANRAKSLVKKWRQLLVVPTSTPSTAVSSPDGGGGDLVNGNSNGQNLSRVTSPALDTGGVGLNSKYSPGLRPTGFSSLPSSASTSPGLPVSRPATPHQPPGSQPISPHTKQAGSAFIPGSNNNKRIRCDDEVFITSSALQSNNGQVTSPEVLPPSAKRLNGNASVSNISNDEKSLHINGLQRLEEDTSKVSTDIDSSSVLAKRKSKSIRQREEAEDVLKQRMNSVRKSFGKVRTTKELVQELALRTGSPGNVTPSLPSSDLDLTMSNSSAAMSKSNLSAVKSELMNRFLESQGDTSIYMSADELDSSLSPPPPPLPPPTEIKNGETVEEVLSRLPPIDSNAILAELESMAEQEDNDDGFEVEGLIPVLRQPKPDFCPELLTELHDGQKESFNGNFSHEGEFKEWFEVVTKRTKDNELLCILPYSVIE